MSEKKRPPRRKIYSFDDMPTVDRDGFDLFGTIYEFAGPTDIGGEGMADILRLQERIPEIHAELDAADDDDKKARLSQELIYSIMQATQLIFVKEIPEDVLSRISVAQHDFIYTSFTAASTSAGRRSGGGGGGAGGAGQKSGDIRDIDWGMLAARCQRFYMAGEPTVWLRMPLTHLAFFSAEVEPLKAEESLRRVHEIRIAWARRREGRWSSSGRERMAGASTA